MHDRFILASNGAFHVITLTLPQQLDHAEFDRINDTIGRAMDDKKGGKFIVDLAAVEYTGSAVLGLLVNLRQQVMEIGGAMVLCGMSERLAQILHTCSLDRLFRTAATQAAAMKAMA